MGLMELYAIRDTLQAELRNAWFECCGDPQLYQERIKQSGLSRRWKMVNREIRKQQPGYTAKIKTPPSY